MWTVAVLLPALFAPHSAFAIIPPGFVTAISLDFVQAISLVAFIVSSAALAIWAAAKVIFGRISSRRTIVAFILLGFVVFVSTSSYFLSGYVEDYLGRRAVEQTIGLFSPDQRKTYVLNRYAIDAFISGLDPRVQEWMREVATVMLTDANAYLSNQGRGPIVARDVPLVDNRTVLRMMDDPNNRAIFLDARDQYERRFWAIRGTQNTRFGDLLNDDLGGLKKEDEIIVICNTDARSWVIANYLIGQGFTNVRTLAGGMLLWAVDGLPLTRNYAFRFLYDVLPYLDEDEVRALKQDFSVREIYFSSFSPSEGTLNSLLMSDAEIEKQIAELTAQGGRYIIRCTSHIYCFDAVSFWDFASAAGIQFVGYTGYRPQPGDIKNIGG